MLEVREPRTTDAAGIGRAWEDAREFYSGLDPQAFLPPNRDDASLGALFCEHLLEEASKPNRFVRVAANLEGEAIGFITASLVEPADTSGRQLMRDEGERGASIDALVVQRSQWRRGAGRALVEAVESWADDAGASLIKLTTYANSPVSVPFYTALGYDNRAIVFLKYLGEEPPST
jgi:GNAT superfamily N-acetyltransferase